MKDERLILVVEDEGNDAELIRLAFQKAGFDNPIQILDRLQDALDYLKGQNNYTDRRKHPFPAVILLDHKIPGGSWPVLQWVRRQPDLTMLPVIVFSGSDDPANQKKASDLGANAYHVKPYRFDDFVAVIKRIAEFWLQRPASPGTDPS